MLQWESRISNANKNVQNQEKVYQRDQWPYGTEHDSNLKLHITDVHNQQKNLSMRPMIVWYCTQFKY